MKIWQRYLFRRLGTSFLFLLLSLFTVYVLLDLSIHGVRFLGNGRTRIGALFLYYLRHFALHLDLFLPLAFLLSSLKTLLELKAHLELVALQTAGLSKKKLLIPFFTFALALSFVGYANYEWVVPDAGVAAERFKISYSKSRRKNPKKESIQSIALEDGSEMIYQRYNTEKREFFDLFWIRSPSDIWAIKTLSLLPPTGHFVDHLVRTPDGLLEKVESFTMRPFPNLHLPEEAIQKPIPTEHLPLSTLFRKSLLASAGQASAKTHLHRKLVLPLLSLLSLFAIAPFATAFSRKRKGFFLVSLSLFGFIVAMTLFESLAILGENQVLAPEIAMWSPLIAIFGLSCRKFWAL